MTSSYPGNPNSFVPENYVVPESPSELTVWLREYLNDLASAINARDIGTYVTQETICGQVWLPTPSTDASTNLVYRQVQRIVVEGGALSTGANAVPHGITVTSTTHFTRVYGIIENPGTLYVPIPNDTVLVTVDATNINITIPVAYNNFDSYIVLEWVSTD